MSRPEHVTCIRHPHAEKQEATLCGEIAMGFVFEDLEHWWCSDRSRLTACPHCLGVIACRAVDEQGTDAARAIEATGRAVIAAGAGDVVEPHVQAPAWCEACGHVWRAVRPVTMEAGKLECPNCSEMAGEDGQVRWVSVTGPPPRERLRALLEFHSDEGITANYHLGRMMEYRRAEARTPGRCHSIGLEHQGEHRAALFRLARVRGRLLGLLAKGS